MIIEVKEINYYGFICKHMDDESGWKIVLQDKEIRFPTLQDAQMAIEEFNNAVKAHKGKEIII